MLKLTTASLLLASLAALSACSSEETSSSSNTHQEISQADTVVASATGEGVPEFNVTQREMDLMVERMGGSAALLTGGQAFLEKIQESIVVSKVMSLKMANELSDDELAELDVKVRQYREELLVKQWVRQNITPEPPTVEEVQNYYDVNPEEFGYQKLKDIEVVTVTPPTDNQSQVRLMKALSNEVSPNSWENVVKSLSDKNIRYSLKKYQLNESQTDLDHLEKARLEKARPDKMQEIHPKLLPIISKLAPNEVSSLVVIDGQWNLVFVKNIKEVPPKPLHEVSGVIRKKLAPKKFRDAVKSHTQQILKSVRITHPPIEQ